MRRIYDATTGAVLEDQSYQAERAAAPVPDTVTRRQLRLWLVRRGIAPSAVEAAIAAMPEPQRTEATIEWQDATQYERTNPLLVQLAGAVLGLSGEALDAALDQAFREAAAY